MQGSCECSSVSLKFSQIRMEFSINPTLYSIQINTYLKFDYEKPEEAVQIAISLSQWSLALQVTPSFSLSIVEPVLVQCLTYDFHYFANLKIVCTNCSTKFVGILHSGMLEDGRVLPAVQLMIKSNKPIGAGKLLIIVSLKEL